MNAPELPKNLAPVINLRLGGLKHRRDCRTVKAALRASHNVRALARSAASIPIQDAGLQKVSGDALDSDMIRNALQSIDVVVQTLGVDFSACRVATLP